MLAPSRKIGGPQVRDGLPARCFYLRTLSRTVPAGCTGPTSQNMRGNPKTGRKSKI